MPPARPKKPDPQRSAPQNGKLGTKCGARYWQRQARVAANTLCLLFCIAMIPGDASALTPSQVFERVAASVVIVDVKDRLGDQLGLGSGVVVDPGVVVTNCHVADKGAWLSVRQGDQEAPAYVVAADRDRDICVLRLVGFQTIGNPIPYVLPVESIYIGQEVFAVGAPRGLELRGDWNSPSAEGWYPRFGGYQHRKHSFKLTLPFHPDRVVVVYSTSRGDCWVSQHQC